MQRSTVIILAGVLLFFLDVSYAIAIATALTQARVPVGGAALTQDESLGLAILQETHKE